MRQKEPEFVVIRREARRILDLADAHALEAAVTQGLQKKLFKPSASRDFLLQQKTEGLSNHLKRKKQHLFDGVLGNAYKQGTAKSTVELNMTIHRLATEDAVKELESLPEKEKKIGANLFRRVAKLNAHAACGQLDTSEYVKLARLTIRLNQQVNREALEKVITAHSRKLGEYTEKLSQAIKNEALIRAQISLGSTDRLN